MAVLGITYRYYFLIPIQYYSVMFVRGYELFKRV